MSLLRCLTVTGALALFAGAARAEDSTHTADPYDSTAEGPAPSKGRFGVGLGGLRGSTPGQTLAYLELGYARGVLPRLGFEGRLVLNPILYNAEAAARLRVATNGRWRFGLRAGPTATLGRPAGARSATLLGALLGMGGTVLPGSRPGAFALNLKLDAYVYFPRVTGVLGYPSETVVVGETNASLRSAVGVEFGLWRSVTLTLELSTFVPLDQHGVRLVRQKLGFVLTF